ncbi:MAG: radical SAM protein [Nitrospirota bacterium]
MLLPPDAHGLVDPGSPSHYARWTEEAARRYLPVNVLMELTHRCHLDCVHCYLEDNHRHTDKRRELTDAEACGVIDQLVEAGGLFLTLSGGELLLRKDAVAIARYARGKGLALRLYTSGTLITDRLIEEMIALHPLSVEFSLYSADNPALHDAITRAPGSHQKTLRAVRVFAGRGVPVVIKTPLMREIFSEYPKIVRLAQELGIAYLLDPTINPKNDGENSPCRFRLSPEQLAALYANPSIPAPPEMQWIGKARRHPEDEVCNLGKTGCAISPFGDVYPTVGFPWSAGNVRERPFGVIWREAPLFRKLRALTVKDLATCSGCEKFAYCGRCCVWALMDDGDLLGPSLWACELAAAKERAAGLPSEPTPYQRARQHNPREPRGVMIDTLF